MMHDNKGHLHFSGLGQVDFLLRPYVPWGWQEMLLIPVPGELTVGGRGTIL